MTQPDILPDDQSIWARLDASQTAKHPIARTGPVSFAFYGRISTEELQDPASARRMQMDAAQRLIGVHGEIVEEYFDIGESRSRPWKQRPEALRLLNDIANPERRWQAIVVGAADRAWHGNQFSQMQPAFEAHGIELWIPEIGGRYDETNVSHDVLLSMSGVMSKAERQKVKARVRDTMASQVKDTGRWQGGRPPFGYKVVDAGKHSKTSLAARGVMAHRLEIDEASAAIVRRIFREYLEGNSLRGIARRLDADGIPTPTQFNPQSATHRSSATSWSAGTIKGILRNPRVTGYEHWGRSKRDEVPLNLDNPSDGYEVRHVKASTAPVRSNTMTHEAIIGLADYAAAQGVMDSKAANGTAAERTINPRAKTLYVFRGLIRCECCGRLMEGWRRNSQSKDLAYRCVRRPDDHERIGHPKTIYVNEKLILDGVIAKLAELLAPETRPDLVAALTREEQAADNMLSHRKKRSAEKLADARLRLKRLFGLVEAGEVDYSLVGPRIAEVTAEVRAYEAEVQATVHSDTRTQTEVEALLAHLSRAFEKAADDENRQLLPELFHALGLEFAYDHLTGTIEMGILPTRADQNSQPARVDKGSAGGGTRTHTPSRTKHFECSASAIPPHRRTTTPLRIP